MTTVSLATGRAESTVWGYLQDFIAERAPADLGAWLDPRAQAAIESALATHGGGFLRPVFEALGGSVTYEEIRAVAAWKGGGGGVADS
ncbi:MAG: helix-turn-helix domain-containing protein [Ardenticatenia bacterium]|nr:helix-turn-helix domain-containing protein [Ardenticatenia bacterium]